MKYFIWTEAIGCGAILRPFLESYAAHHDTPIHIIGYERDLEDLPRTGQFIPLVIGNPREGTTAPDSELRVSKNLVENAYESGHNGTALVWAMLAKERSEEILIHLDADTVFLGNVVDPVVEVALKGYGLVGTRRPYRHSRANKSRWQRLATHFMADTVNTHCFAFRRDLLDESLRDLHMLMRGAHPNRAIGVLFPVIDFFDRVSYRLMRRGGVFYLDSEDQGRHGEHTHESPHESKMITFSAVGSGYAFSRNPRADVPETYKHYAMKSYSLFANNLLGIKVDYEQLDNEFVKSQLSRLDRNSWTLS